MLVSPKSSFYVPNRHHNFYSIDGIMLFCNLCPLLILHINIYIVTSEQEHNIGGTRTADKYRRNKHGHWYDKKRYNLCRAI